MTEEGSSWENLELFELRQCTQKLHQNVTDPIPFLGSTIRSPIHYVPLTSILQRDGVTCLARAYYLYVWAQSYQLCNISASFK